MTSAVKLSLLFLLLSSCLSVNKVESISGQTMGTTYSVKYVAASRILGPRHLKVVLDELLEKVNDLMSTWRQDSELSRFNNHKRMDWFSISQETYFVISEALKLSHETEGLYDVTVGPLVNAWGFGHHKVKGRPSPEGITEILKSIGYKKVTLRQSAGKYFVKKDHPELEIDLSSIAKGFGVDMVANFLEGQGIHNYMVEIGGEIRTKGEKGPRSPWILGIERPSAGDRQVMKVISLQDKAMATSGDYRNFFKDKNKIYSHTIDPKTGNPVQHPMSSVTVISDTCVQADALATAMMVMGPQKALAFAKKREIPALIVVKSGKESLTIEMTEAFRPYMKKK